MLRISEFILNFVLNSLWQSVVIFAFAAIASWFLKNGPARFRHTLWVTALLACLVAPLLPGTRWVSGVQAVASQVPLPLITELKNASPVTSHSEKDFAVDHIGPSRSQPINTSTRTALFLTLAYALFIFGRAIRLVRFWRRKERLRRSATGAGLAAEVEVAAKRCRTLLGAGGVRVTLSNEARVPYTLGARCPMIVLPEAFCTDADEARLLTVIGHETAHVARKDFLSNLVCELVALPISFHPLTFLIKRQIERARELACDELVTKHILAPGVYARSLLWAADVTSQRTSQAFMLSIFDGRILEERIMRLTRNKSTIAPGIARVITFAALSVLFVSAMSLSMFSLELQTQARAMESIQLLNLPALQHPVAPSASPSVGETQASAPADEARTTACQAGRRGDVQAIPLLIAQLGDDSKAPFVKCYAVGNWSPALETFKHSSPGEQAALALASFGRPAFVPLSNQLDSRNATVRRNAAWAIGELTNMPPGERAGAVPQLISLLGDTDEWVRMAAARALGELRDERALPQLVATLADENWRVRELAVWALSEMKDKRAVTALCNVLLSDVRVEVRRGAAEALGEIRSAEALPYLKQALNDAETGVSAKAAWAIQEIEG
jgi:HEAT repeat protein/beta-lactamase regulating signal transducer with metallopeptidase domain